MAYRLTAFEFEKPIPSFKVIRSTFADITGFQLSIIGHLSLENVDSRIEYVTKTMVDDYNKVEAYHSEQRMIHELPVEEMLKFKATKTLIRDEDNYIEYLSFYHRDFYEIEFEKRGNTIELLWMMRQKYFRIALEKTFYTLNDDSFQKDKVVPNYRKKQFKKLKKWDDYKWYNRPRK